MLVFPDCRHVSGNVLRWKVPAAALSGRITDGCLDRLCPLVCVDPVRVLGGCLYALVGHPQTAARIKGLSSARTGTQVAQSADRVGISTVSAESASSSYRTD